MLYDLRLDLDTRCNLQCVYCDNRDIPSERKASLDLSSFEPLLPAINSNCWSVYLSCGGEPTLHPQFRTLLEQLRTQLTRPDISMVTNGILLNDANRNALLASPVNRILVSIDSHDADLFARLCGTKPEIAEKIFTNLEQFALERMHHPKPLHLIVTAIAMKSTLAGLPELAKWLRTLHVSAFNVQWLNPLEYTEMRQEVLDPHSFEVRSTLLEIQKILKGSDVLLDWPRDRSWDKIKSVWANRTLFRNRFAYLQNAVRKVLGPRLGMPCVHANNTFYLDPNGEFNMCPHRAIPLEFPRSGAQMTTQMRSIFKLIRTKRPDYCNKCQEHYNILPIKSK